MARLPDELAPRVVARMLGVHVNTVYRWCDLYVSNLPSRLRARRDLTGHYWIKVSEVHDLQKRA